MQNEQLIALYQNSLHRNHRFTEKQKRVLVQTLKLFSEKGYANTSTSEIAAAANTSETVIFKNFKSKENLLYTVLAPLSDAFQKSLTEFSAVLKREKNPTLEFFVTTIVSKRLVLDANYVDIFRIFIAEMLYQKPGSHRLEQLIPIDFTHIFNPILDKLKLEHFIVNWENEEIMRYILTNIITFLMLHEVVHQSSELNKMRESKHLITFLVNGLQPNTDVKKADHT